MAPDTGNVNGRSQLVLIAVLTVIFSVIVLRSAWVCDDAYISFRTIDNFVNGYGLTWNTGERVQAYTNPLWVFVTAAVYVFSGEFYYTSIFLSLVLSIGMVVILARKVALSVQSAALAALSHLLLVIFAAVYFGGQRTPRRLFWLALIAALGMLNRLDTVLLYLPALVAAFFGTPGGGRIKRVVLGMLPIIGWEVFSLIYYGFPFPNTYYAKLKAGIPAADLARQGLMYYVDTLDLDPLTLIVIAAGIVLVWVGRKRDQVPFVLGMVLYLIYIVRIGGDFMTGRFFAAPLLVSVILLSRFGLPSKGIGLWAPLGAVLLLSLTSPRSPLLADQAYGTGDEGRGSNRGIADERGFYYQSTGLLRDARARSMPDHWWIFKGKQLKASGQTVAHDATIGFRGYAAGPLVHIVDELALADPLLSRLPAAELDDWRIGHVRRTIPMGYLVTCRTGINSIRDSSLAEYYEHLHDIIAGPIWSWQRTLKVARMNLGLFDNLLSIDESSYDLLVPYADVCSPKQRGTVWNRAGNLILKPRGVMIEMDSVVSSLTVELSVDHNDSYELVYWLGVRQVGATNIAMDLIPELGLRVDTIEVQIDQGVNRFDGVHIRPVDGDDRYSVGHFRLLGVSDERP